MKMWEEILDDMKEGMSWSEITRKYRSKSQAYEALRIFMQESKDKYQKFLDKLVEAQEELENADGQRGQIIEKIRSLSKEVNFLSDKRDHLAGEVKSLNEELVGLRSNIVDLEKRGFTSSIVKEIAEVEKGSGKKLLKQIGTVDKYNKMVEGVSKLKKEKKLLKEEVEAEQNKKRALKIEVHKLEQEYDELRVRTFAYRDAAKIVEEFFDDGYSVEEIRGVRCGLKLLQIDGDREISIKRLIDGLLKAKSLYVLEKELNSIETQLEELKRDLDILTQKRDVIEHGMIQNVNRVRLFAERKISESGCVEKKAIEESSKVYKEFLHKQEGSFLQIIESLKKDVGVYGELNQDIGKLRENVRYGQAFWGLNNSDDYLASLNSQVIAGVVDRVAYWTSINFNEKILADQKMALESGLSQFYSYDVTALFRVLAEVIRNRALDSMEGFSGA